MNTKTVSRTYNKIITPLIILCLLLLTACGGGSEAPDSSSDASAGFDVPDFKDAVFHEDAAQGTDEAMVDLSSSSDGYFALLCDSDARLKLQVLKGDETYTYDIKQGDPQIFPFQSGDGDYSIKVMKNVDGNKYYELYTTSASVSLSNPRAPFLRPNTYADYSESSECVRKASELAKNASSESDFVNSVYDYICQNVSYDYDEAKNVSPGYVPDPDEVMSSGKGICFDYASLGASMLRSQGIPTKIIFGYVAPDNLYHAWNMFYTEATGWTTVEFSVEPGDWSRVDLTFSANGQDADFIGDGSNYQDVYQY
ncbi:MAG: transglutaminase-like domain-containing protein [Bacillota bacterium]|nr:transglutaminase-like domain-containing protein [Bacillota bacterium]